MHRGGACVRKSMFVTLRRLHHPKPLNRLRFLVSKNGRLMRRGKGERNNPLFWLFLSYKTISYFYISGIR